MLRRTGSILFATGLMAPALVLAGHSAAGAVDQDLVLSATSGAPGTVVSASSASCGSDPDGEIERYLRIQLISGTAPNERLAGIGTGLFGDPAVITVPDWVDDAEPAIIEAECLSYSWYDDDVTAEAYDPVPFDIDPGVGPATQTRTVSRTRLRAGQALSVSAVGCTGGEYGGVAVFPGDDLSGRTFDQPVTEGNAEIQDGAFEAEAYFNNAGTSWSASSTDDGPSIIEELTEIPNGMAPGPYALVPFCGGDGGISLVYEPISVDVTGTAPTDDLDLTSPKGSRAVSFAGRSCTATVSAGLFPIELDSTYGGSSGGGSGGRTRLGDAPGARLRSPFTRSAQPWRDPASRRSASMSMARLLDDDDLSFRDVTPDADGVWTTDDAVSFDHGLVYGFAMCGDALGDGFVYDPQIVEVQAAIEPPATTTTTVTTTTTLPVTPPPAIAVPGIPNYAG